MSLPIELHIQILDKLPIHDLIRILNSDQLLYNNYYIYFSQKIDQYKFNIHVGIIKHLVYSTRVIKYNGDINLKIDDDDYKIYWHSMLLDLEKIGATEYKGISLQRNEHGKYIFKDQLNKLFENDHYDGLFKTQENSIYNEIIFDSPILCFVFKGLKYGIRSILEDEECVTLTYISENEHITIGDIVTYIMRNIKIEYSDAKITYKGRNKRKYNVIEVLV